MADEAETRQALASSSNRTSPVYLIRLWFGVSEPVGQAAYAFSGFGLMLFKYGAETLLIWLHTGAVFMPWEFLNPLLSMRTQMLQSAPHWVAWSLFVWSLPFLWIAISMSVRRAADGGKSPWLGLLVLVPLINLVFMIVLCFMPRAPHGGWSRSGASARSPEHGQVTKDDEALSATMSLGKSLMFGAGMLVISVYFLESYGAALFMGTPLLMGAVAAHDFNQTRSRSHAASVGLGLATVSFAGVALLLFALEGLICIVMATPLVLPLGILGGVLGKTIADYSRRGPRELLATIMLLPGLAWVESSFVEPVEFEVMSAVEIEASADTVWRSVLDFPDLPPPAEWYFRWGIACPERARIEGEGIGAVRYCEFSTGTFVEPITAWEPARRLAFDVTDQPAPMFELSPYRHVHPPHLDGYLRSNRGEFRLIALADGRTRLEGRTWYEFEMFPQAYWTLWSNAIIHRIHNRVLLHVKRLCERDQSR